MTSTEIRDRLLEQRTLYNESLRNSAKAKEEISSILGGISDNEVELLLSQGIDVRCLTTFDLERVQKDPEYLKECEDSLDKVITSLHSFLEEAVRV